MRLLSLTVRCYRIHKEFTVEFDPLRNLIGSPNESGKSTLVEAAHRALFLRAKTGGSVQKEMESTLHRGDPEVRLVFEARGCRWELEKCFAGPRGSALLKSESGVALRGDEAEAKLAELLGVETAGGKGAAGQLGRLWSHLWVWQGTALEQPSEFTGQHKDPLVRHLQRYSAVTMLQSDTDQRVAKQVANSYDKLFNIKGHAKSNSPAELAKQRLETAQAVLAKAQAEEERLAQAVNDLARAEREIAEIEEELPVLQKERAETEAKRQEVQARRREEEEQQRQVEEAAARRDELEEVDRKIRELKTQLNEETAALQPRETELARQLEAEKETRAASQQAEAKWKEAGDVQQRARWHADVAAAALMLQEKEEARQELEARVQDAAAVQEEIEAERERLAALPALTSKDLAHLRQLEQRVLEMQASLRAMATGVELVEARGEVRLNGAPLTVGAMHTLTEEGVLSLENGTRLRILPGGGQSLAEARHDAEEARLTLTTVLQRFTLRDMKEATATLEQRQILEQRLDTLEARWQTLGGAQLENGLRMLKEECTAARAEWERLVTMGREKGYVTEAPAFPKNLALAKEHVAATREARDKAEAAESEARHYAEQQRKKWQSVSDELAQLHEQVARARQALRDMETSLRTREETHGDEDTRHARLAAAREAEAQARAVLQETQKALTALNPELLDLNLERLTRAITSYESRKREAENLQLLARDRLASDGSVDPEAQLLLARARHREAQALYEAEERRAKAIKLLHELFTSARDTIDHKLMEPLSQRISGYLSCLFGPNTTAQVRLSDEGIEELMLSRNGTTFPFASLSGGTKEQTAAAVRLAMAEILAEEHDGCLPVVFDDAFAYSDPERIRALPQMLDYAATRGLQIIVLNCSPREYAGFGAKEIRLGQS